MKNVIKREQCKLACGLPSVNILSKVSKFKVLLYLKKSGLDKQGKAPIMGRITLNRSKELKSHFSERRTAALVYKLEKYMMQLVQIMHKVTELTDEYRQKNLEK
jgi:hypothetical protein